MVVNILWISYKKKSLTGFFQALDVFAHIIFFFEQFIELPLQIIEIRGQTMSLGVLAVIIIIQLFILAFQQINFPFERIILSSGIIFLP